MGWEKLLLSTAETAELLGVSRSYVYTLIGKGRLPVVRLGKRTLIHRQQLIEQLEREATREPERQGERRNGRGE